MYLQKACQSKLSFFKSVCISISELYKNTLKRYIKIIFIKVGHGGCPISVIY